MTVKPKTHLVTSLILATMALAAPAVAADDTNDAARAFVDDRFNNEGYPVIPCPTVDDPPCLSPDCSKDNGVCYDVSGDADYWSARRISLGSGTTNITACGDHVGIWTYFTWSGDGTGNAGQVQQKLNAVSVSVTLDGVPVEVMESPSAPWEFRIEAGPVNGPLTRSITRACTAHMTALSADCPLEDARDPGEQCWDRTWGVDLSRLSAGTHTLVTTLHTGKGFPGVCPATQPTCHGDGTQEFDENTPCDHVYTRVINVNVVGGCN